MVEDVGYISISVFIFSALHSITASSHFKDKVKSLVGDQIYDGWFRFLYNLLFSSRF